MSAEMHYAVFAPLVGAEFEILPSDPAAAPVAMRLAEATLSHQSPQHEQFSLFWEGAAALPQGTYRFRHTRAGEFDIFIVPLGRTDAATRYESVFNLRRTEP